MDTVVVKGQGRHFYPTFTHALLKSEAFPELMKHYQTPPKEQPIPFDPQSYFPDLMKTFDERFTGAKYSSAGFYLPMELDDESDREHSVSNSDAPTLDGASYHVGGGGDKIVAGSIFTSFWRKVWNVLHGRRSQDIVYLPPEEEGGCITSSTVYNT